MTRPARVIVDTSALQSNLALVRERVPNSKVMAIVKADGYGHGVNRVGRALSDADAFGVACMEEAIILREGGAKNPIVLLEGPFDQSEIALIEQYDFQAVVHNQNQVEMLLEARCQAPAWVKVDSGMHRIGFEPTEVEQVLEKLATNGNYLRCMTHLANAHHLDDSHTQTQLETFSQAIGDFNGEKSIANSAGLLAWQSTISDWARPGIMLYGVSPFSEKLGSELGLKPAMTVKSELISVREVAAGGSVGYGRGYVCDENMKVGVVAFGYGDGYPRACGTGAPILVNGQRTQVIGEASMDMLTVDLRGVSNPKIGDEVTLWGDGLPVEVVAKAANTIPYELLCRVKMRARYIEN